MQSSKAAFLAILLAITTTRVVVLWLSNLNLHGDEAQYWSWAQDLDWGYFTKPPMIAYVIKATTAVCGNGEACVRLSSPLIHAGTGFFTYLIGKTLYDDRVGFWAGLTVLTLPVVTLSSALVSTDVPLLLFWSLALYSFIRVLDGGDTKWTIALGVFIGLGFLAKYAMAYFIAGALLYCLATPDARKFLADRRAYIALVIAFLVFSPNLVWNVQSGWATVGHLGDNANLKGDLFDIFRPFQWLGEQFGVFGPILLAGYLILVPVVLRTKPSNADRMMLAFSLPILLVILGQAFLSRANANWAATAYLAMTVFTVAGLLRFGKPAMLKVSLALHLTVFALLSAYVSFYPDLPVPAKRHPLNKMVGWPEVAAEVSAAADKYPGRLIVTDDRKTMASLLYYMRGRNPDMVIWDYDGYPTNHYELAAPYTPERGDKVLIVEKWGVVPAILKHFEASELIGKIRLPDHPDREKYLGLYLAEGYEPADKP